VLAVGLAGGVVWTARHASRLGPVARGGQAPDFTLPRIDGKPGSLSLAALRGHVVVLDFWATWCPPCLAMLPTMHQLSAELAPAGVEFLGIDSDGPQTTPEDVTRFLGEHGAPYPVVYDQGTVNELFRVSALPTMVIVDKDGTISRVLTGLTSKGTLERAIQAALAH
jgi:thiol-disulfide isomerase/thioredoxin